MASPTESRVNLFQSAATEKKETNYSMQSMNGIINSEISKHVSVSGESNKYVEAEIKVTHVHNYSDAKEGFRNRIREIRDRLEINFTCGKSLTHVAHREENYDHSVCLQLLSPSNRTIVGEIALSDLLSTANGRLTPPKRILIMSKAGDGKTTLCHKIAHDWAEERADNLAIDFHLVLYYDLTQATVNDNFETALKNLCCEKDEDLPLVENVIGSDSTSTLLILDGLDQVENEVQTNIYDFIQNVFKSKSSFRRPTVIMTCNSSMTESTWYNLFHSHILLSRRPPGFQRDSSTATAANTNQVKFSDICGISQTSEDAVETILKSLKAKKPTDENGKMYETEVLKIGAVDCLVRGKRTTEKDVQKFFSKFQ